MPLELSRDRPQRCLFFQYSPTNVGGNFLPRGEEFIWKDFEKHNVVIKYFFITCSGGLILDQKEKKGG